MPHRLVRNRDAQIAVPVFVIASAGSPSLKRFRFACGAGTSAALTASTILVSNEEGLWKYISHQSAVHDAAWVTPEYPDGNVTIGPVCQPCLFNLLKDEEERHNQAAQQTELTSRLAAELASQIHFQTGADHYVGKYTQCVSMDNFTATHRGFLGPLCTLSR